MNFKLLNWIFKSGIVGTILMIVWQRMRSRRMSIFHESSKPYFEMLGMRFFLFFYGSLGLFTFGSIIEVWFENNPISMKLTVTITGGMLFLAYLIVFVFLFKEAKRTDFFKHKDRTRYLSTEIQLKGENVVVWIIRQVEKRGYFVVCGQQDLSEGRYIFLSREDVEKTGQRMKFRKIDKK